MMVIIIFWTSILIVLYAYVGYPIVTLMLSVLFRNKNKKAKIEPFVSLLITAYNEEKEIRKKLDNSLELDYPKGRYEIVVASDGSTDRTDEIVRDYESNRFGVRVVLHRVEGRLGKTAAQNSAVKICRGDIIIFSDAASMYQKSVIRKIVRNYADPNVGAVSGKYEYFNRKASSVGFATILFWKLENFIKTRQTRIKTITGCCGCIYSLRKKLYTELPADIISDLVEPLTILKKGYRIVFEPEALALEETAGDTRDEFKMRIRVIIRGMNGMLYVKELFNPLKYPFVAFQLISHKLLRWLVPVFAIFIFASNAVLVSAGWLYFLMLLAQIAFYALAFVGYFKDKKGVRNKFYYLPLYFCTVNLASLISMYRVAKKENIVIWQTKR